MKPCKECKNVKPFSDFSKNSKNKDGYRYFCKDCEKAKAKAYYVRNAEKIKSKVNKWQAEHVQLVKDYKKSFYHKHKAPNEQNQPDAKGNSQNPQGQQGIV